jgi:hypothetical protein
MRRPGRGESGTTIVEIAVGMAVGAVLVAGILFLVEQSQKAYMHTSEVTDLQQNVRVAMDRVTRIIQAAGVNPQNQAWGGGTPAFTAFREAGRNCIRLYSDLNGDTDLNVDDAGDDEADENVYFHWRPNPVGEPLMEQRGTLAGQLDAGTTWVAPAGGTEQLARGIESLTFQYFTGINDATPNTELATPAPSDTACVSLSDANRARISRVVVTITGRACVNASCSDLVRKTLVSDARPRNVP